jgi:YaiO family outer membrane protein
MRPRNQSALVVMTVAVAVASPRADEPATGQGPGPAVPGPGALEPEPTAPPAPAPVPQRAGIHGFVEAGSGRDRLTAGEPSWSDEYVRGHLQVTPSDAVALDVSRQSHFGAQGTYFGLGYTRILSDRWYGSVDAGASDRGFFLPRARAQGAVHLKWLSRRNLVTSLGVRYSRARDAHSDRALAFEAAYYFDAPWIVQLGVGLNESDPGTVLSARGRAAVTYGRAKRHYVTLTYERGRESYQLIAEDRAVTDFASDEASVVWRQWLAGGFGFNARAVHYTNPTYRRWGGALGLFWEF